MKPKQQNYTMNCGDVMEQFDPEFKKNLLQQMNELQNAMTVPIEYIQDTLEPLFKLKPPVAEGELVILDEQNDSRPVPTVKTYVEPKSHQTNHAKGLFQYIPNDKLAMYCHYILEEDGSITVTHSASNGNTSPPVVEATQMGDTVNKFYFQGLLLKPEWQIIRNEATLSWELINYDEPFKSLTFADEFLQEIPKHQMRDMLVAAGAIDADKPTHVPKQYKVKE